MELGLVENRKELQKKRNPAGNRKTKNAEDFLRANASSDDDDDNDSDGNDEPAERRLEMSIVDSDNSSDDDSSSVRTNVKSKERICQPALPTPGLINSKLTKVLDEGWREAVEWISNLLDETADERESDGRF
ncbi:hypothetical protein Avbf_03851 [Armadillidium vulgare]|nr:hypothetical protein Avbf_03851 [Armadillidium vulgare]